jgi:hypothetical protein
LIAIGLKRQIKPKVFQRLAIYLASSGMEKFVQKILGLKTAKSRW